MPVPKRKTSKSRRDKRSSTWFIRPKSSSLCVQCDKPIVPHVMCRFCGYYKGRKVMRTATERRIDRKQRQFERVQQEAQRVQEQEEALPEEGPIQE